jgi:hypothetical protein
MGENKGIHVTHLKDHLNLVQHGKYGCPSSTFSAATTPIVIEQLAGFGG